MKLITKVGGIVGKTLKSATRTVNEAVEQIEQRAGTIETKIADFNEKHDTSDLQAAIEVAIDAIDRV